MKILIVDDELPIREWLKMSMANAKGQENEVITAGNGSEAWDMFLENAPNMVITDIKMPKMSGLELLQKIKEFNSRTYVVMLTSYSDFEYAREAMKYKANEYVLKNEITKEVLEQIVKNYFTTGIDFERSHKIPYIKDLLEKQEESDFPIKKAQDEPIFAIAFKEGESDKEVFERYLDSFVYKIQHCYYEKDICIWVCSYNYKKTHSLGACFGEAMSFCRNIALLKETGIGFSGFAEDVLEACKCSKLALNLGFYELHQSVYIYSNKGIEGLQKINKIRRDVISMIHKDRQDEVKEYIGELFGIIEKEQILELEHIRICFQDIVDAYKVSKLEFAGHELEELCGKTKDRIGAIDNLNELKEELDAFLSALKGTMVIGEKAYSGYVKSAIAYVVNNYSCIESLSEVADYVNINADYFSRIFKNETGVTFNSYLTSYRIQKAVELLSKTEMKVYEVAENVGYSNLSYFSRVFKKVTGVNPFFYKN